jgi:hypothetical protein
VFKKVSTSTSTRRPSITGPPESCNFYPRYLQLNYCTSSLEILKLSEKKYTPDSQYSKSSMLSVANLG